MSSEREIWERSSPELEPEEAVVEKPSSASGRARRLSEVEQKNFSTSLNFKHCHMGFATDMSWLPAYCIINEGMLKLFNSEGESSGTPLFEVALDKNHRATPWHHKKFTKMENDGQDEHISFFIEDETCVGWVKVLKLGFFKMSIAERVMRCVEFNTENKTETEVPSEIFA